MAQPYCTGSKHIYCGLGSNYAPLYLGTCESYPRRETQRKWGVVMNDASGTEIPYDYSFQGEMCLLQCALTRFNWTVVRLLEAMPNPFTGTRGTQTGFDIGTLMGTEGAAFPVWVANQYGTALNPKVSMTGSGLPPGRRFVQCISFGPDVEEGATRAQVLHFTFLAWRRYTPTTRGGVLWDENFTGLPVPN